MQSWEPISKSVKHKLKGLTEENQLINKEKKIQTSKYKENVENPTNFMSL